jgi:signal peptidase II
MKNLLQKYVSLLLAAGLVVAADQITKYLVRLYLPYVDYSWSPAPWIEPYFSIVNRTNTGATLSMFSGMSGVFTLFAAAVSIAIIVYYPRLPASERLLRLVVGLYLGGTLGNLIDRLLFNGRVTDFVMVGRFTVFNLADLSITSAVILLVIGLLLRDDKSKAAPSQPEEQPPY